MRVVDCEYDNESRPVGVICEDDCDYYTFYLHKKGKWIEKPNRLQRCSSCGNVRPYINDEAGGVLYWSGSYCIVCGAKMGGSE